MVRDILCVILAGGEGNRLKPVLKDRLPKCLAPIGQRPFLYYQIELLRRKGFYRFLLCVGKMASDVEKKMGDGSHFGINISYSREMKPLGTAGAIRNATPYLNQTFLVVNGDTYLDIDYRSFIENHFKKGSELSIAVTKRSERMSYGTVRLDSNNRAITFSVEGKAIERDYINGGAYIIDPIVLGLIPKDRPASLEEEVIPKCISDGIKCYGYVFKGSFYDIGTPDRYEVFKKFLGKDDHDISSASSI